VKLSPVESQAEHRRLPAPASEADATAVLATARKLSTASGQGELLDELTLRLLSYSATGDLSPMAAMFGGIIGQEVGGWQGWCECCCKLPEQHIHDITTCRLSHLSDDGMILLVIPANAKMSGNLQMMQRPVVYR
jgi:hypothetical protein